MGQSSFNVDPSERDSRIRKVVPAFVVAIPPTRRRRAALDLDTLTRVPGAISSLLEIELLSKSFRGQATSRV